MNVDKINNLRKIATGFGSDLPMPVNSGGNEPVMFAGGNPQQVAVQEAERSRRPAPKDAAATGQKITSLNDWNYLWLFGKHVGALNDFQKHYNDQRFDTDTGTPGVQLSSKFFTDPATAKHLAALGQIKKNNWDNYLAKVKQLAENAKKNAEATGAAFDEKAWIKQNHPLAAAYPMLLPLMTAAKAGRYQSIAPALASAMNVARQYQSNGAFNSQQLWQDIKDNKHQALRDFSRHYMALDQDTDIDKKSRGHFDDALAAASAHYYPGIPTMGTLRPLVRAVNDGTVDSYYWLKKNIINPDGSVNQSVALSDDAKPHLQRVNQALNNEDFSTSIGKVAPNVGAQLNKYKPQLSFLNDNHASLQALNEFRSNPLMFILSNLFSGDASRLYSVVDSMGKMYLPRQINADPKWNEYLVGGNKQMQSYAQYLPWLQLLGNIRSGFDGYGFDRYQV